MTMPVPQILQLPGMDEIIKPETKENLSCPPTHPLHQVGMNETQKCSLKYTEKIPNDKGFP